jgi:hypothetical protein
MYIIHRSMPALLYKWLNFQPFWPISSWDITSFMRGTYKKSPCMILFLHSCLWWHESSKMGFKHTRASWLSLVDAEWWKSSHLQFSWKSSVGIKHNGYGTNDFNWMLIVKIWAFPGHSSHIYFALINL